MQTRFESFDYNLNPVMPSSVSPSLFLYGPERNKQGLKSLTESNTPYSDHALFAYQAIQNTVRARNYPCVPAILSVEKHQYLVGIYSGFGTGIFADEFYRDLMYFKEEQKNKNMPYLSFWAIFMEPQKMSETEFETALWHELSSLSALSDPSTPWDPRFSSHPDDKNFCLSFGGEAVFAVGMHANSTRAARRFPWPTIVVNMYSQFTDMMEEDLFEEVVRKNREREMRYAGSLNPMVVKYGNEREAIQFSGKENDPEWNCPYKSPQIKKPSTRSK